MDKKRRALVGTDALKHVRRALMTLVVGVAVAVALSACGSSSSSSGSSSSSSSAGSAAAVNSTVTIGVYHDELFDSIDTNLWDATTSWSVARLTCVPLVWYPNATGAAGEALSPGLAETMPTVSANGLTYTFKIREGLKFSNGQPLTAADIKYTFYRIFKINPGAFIVGIAGSEAVINGKANEVSGIVASGNTLTIHLTERNGAFLQSLSQMYTCPVPTGTVLKPDETGNLPASGPYKIASYTPNQELVLERNPYFNTALGPKGVAGKIVFDLALDESQALPKIKLGQIATTLTSLPTSDGLLAKSDPTLSGHVYSNTTPTLSYMWMNNDVAPFNNADVRRAVNYALDRDEIVKVNGGTSAARPWAQMLPPQLAGSYTSPYSDTPNLTKAKELMKESGIKLPVSSTLYVPSVDNFPLDAQVIQQDLGAIGINLTLHVASSPVISAYASIRAHHVPAGFGMWTQDYPDGGDFMQLVDPRLASGEAEHSRFEVKSLIPTFKAASEATGSARAADWQALAHEVQEKYAPWAPLYMQVWTQATASNVTGFEWQNLVGLPLLTSIGVK